ncbi:uncharacterized protein LOC131429252 [Malaya genurostris]|uniref:uncharacterized protein LOC131429252 n=1 Tax=Malaya genurostris TaxID=325434 RepID=UPI0026F3F378|nr:uncharacterized protein LOC131429252 [Malaya genurostris]
MIEVKERQTAAFLKDKVLAILARYDVTLLQVFSITVDNGANMLACIRQLKDEFEAPILSLYDEIEESDVANETAQEVADNITNDFNDQARENLNMVRCAVHTLQLAILDVVNKSNEKVKQITEIAKRCKNIKYKTSFEYHHAKYPPVWCQTRWGGIYKMFEYFTIQKQFFSQLALEFPELGKIFIERTHLCFNLTKFLQMEFTDLAIHWDFIQNYLEAFKPCYVCTKKLQESHVSLSDFYMEWLITICLVKKQENNPFAHELTKALSTRLENLRTSMAFKMAIYLDPRFNYTNSNVFNGDEKEHIQKFIIQTWARIKYLDPRYSIEQTCTTNATEAFNESDNFITEIFGGSLSTNDTSSTFQQQLKTLQAEMRQCTALSLFQRTKVEQQSH